MYLSSPFRSTVNTSYITGLDIWKWANFTRTVSSPLAKTSQSFRGPLVRIKVARFWIPLDNDFKSPFRMAVVKVQLWESRAAPHRSLRGGGWFDDFFRCRGCGTCHCSMATFSRWSWCEAGPAIHPSRGCHKNIMGNPRPKHLNQRFYEALKIFELKPMANSMIQSSIWGLLGILGTVQVYVSPGSTVGALGLFRVQTRAGRNEYAKRFPVKKTRYAHEGNPKWPIFCKNWRSTPQKKGVCLGSRYRYVESKSCLINVSRFSAFHVLKLLISGQRRHCYTKCTAYWHSAEVGGGSRHDCVVDPIYGSKPPVTTIKK